MNRSLALGYGIAVYALFLCSFLYLLAFLAGLPVPRTVDDGPAAATWAALAVDSVLLLLFGLQHSVMARAGFKRAWTRFVPQPIERSTYVLATVLVMALLFAAWRPLPFVVWSAAGAAEVALYALFAAGAFLVLLATFLIDHFELFGLRQVFAYFRGRRAAQPHFRLRGPYRLVRHPLYVGWLVTFWATPRMTAGHLLLAAGMTAYILLAIRFEERDLVRAHGADYVEYRRKVPMLLPSLSRQRGAAMRSKADAATM